MEGRGSTEEECVMCYIFLDVKAGASSSLTGPKLHCTILDGGSCVTRSWNDSQNRRAFHQQGQLWAILETALHFNWPGWPLQHTTQVLSWESLRLLCT